MKIAKILAPTDFSKPSLKGLEYAIELARRFRAQLAIVFVVEPIQYVPLHDTILYATTLLSEQQKSAKAQLTNLAKRLRKRRLKVQTVLSTGTPLEQIIEAAEGLKADIIVMATHGRSGLSHVLLGSVAEKVVRTASCPVLTVRDGKPLSRRRKTSRAHAKRKRTGHLVK